MGYGFLKKGEISLILRRAIAGVLPLKMVHSGFSIEINAYYKSCSLFRLMARFLMLEPGMVMFPSE